MASRSKGTGKSSKTAPERPATNWSTASLEGSALILSIVKEAATFAPIAELKTAACTALHIMKTIQIVKENKVAYQRLGDDAGELIVALWHSFKQVPEEWLSGEMRDILEGLTHTLEEICSFVQEQLSRNKAIRVMSSRADAVKINEYRKKLNYTMQKFELQAHMNINDVVMQLMRKNDLLPEQILRHNEEEVHSLENTARDARDREIAEKIHDEEIETLREIPKLKCFKQVEVDRGANHERWHSEELKKIERESKDRKKELERLRAAASAVEQANRLKKAEEEEIARLKRTLAAARDQRNNQARKGKSSSAEDEEEEEDWDFIVEEAASEEEENRSARSSKVKRNHSGSSKRRSETLEDFTDDGEEDLGYLKSSKMKTAPRKSSSVLLREDDMQSIRSSKTRIAPPNRNLSSASLGEDDLCSQVRRNHSGSSKKRPVVLEDSTDDDEDLQQLMRTALRLDKDDLQLMSSKIIKMALLNLPSALLRAQETQDDYTDDEDGYEPLLPRQSPKPKMCVPGAIIDSDVGNTTNTTASNFGNVTINFCV